MIPQILRDRFRRFSFLIQELDHDILGADAPRFVKEVSAEFEALSTLNSVGFDELCKRIEVLEERCARWFVQMNTLTPRGERTALRIQDEFHTLRFALACVRAMSTK